VEQSSGAVRRAYVVDDDDDFRDSLLVLLDSAGWVSEGFASGSAFLERSALLQPGALILDVRMEGVGGLDLLEAQNPSLLNFAIIVVTGHGDVETAVRSLKGGAIDFIAKPFEGERLLEKLSSSYDKLLSDVRLAKRVHRAHEKVVLLSGREKDVLRGMLAGASHKEIARHLGISDRTVEMYRNNLVRRMGVRTTLEALHLGVLAKLEPADIANRPHD